MANKTAGGVGTNQYQVKGRPVDQAVLATAAARAGVVGDEVPVDPMLTAWQQGVIVTNLTAASGDIGHIIEDDEWGFEWRATLMPLDAVDDLHPDLETAIAHLARDNGDTYEQDRFAHVEEWMREVGPEEALRISPCIAAFTDGRWKYLDGWHRRVVAHHVFGMKVVPVLIGRPVD